MRNCATLLKSFFNQKLEELVNQEFDAIDAAKALDVAEKVFEDSDDEPQMTNPQLLGLLNDASKVSTISNSKFYKPL